MHCDDFTRTDAERRSRLQAPISRRRLLQAGLGATIVVRRALDAAGAGVRGRRGERRRRRRADPRQRLRPRPVASLQHAPPPTRYDLRPALKVAQPIALPGTGFGVHPALGEGLNGGLKGLFDRGRLGFIPGIDYANPYSAYFNSRHFWETGLISISPVPGTAGALDLTATVDPTTPSRRCRWTRACRRCCAAAATPSRPSNRPTTPSRGSRRLGRVAGAHAWSTTRPSPRSAPRARARPPSSPVALQLHQTGRVEGDHPGIGPGANDPPLGRVRQPRVLHIAVLPSVRVRVGPRRELTAGDRGTPRRRRPGAPAR